MTETDQGSAMEGAPRRTAVITVLCVIGFAGAVLTVPVLFSPGVRAVGDWYPVFLGWAALASLGCVAAMWRMYRLGVYFYAFFALANQLVTLYMQVWRWPDLVVPAVFLGLALTQVPKMR